MGNNVFANGREVSCKAADGTAICAFPDVCFTPPENPATPPGVPIPYPNTGMATDTTSGSKKVKVSGKEVMLKNKSYFKKSMGDEAGSAAKKGVVTSTNRGKVYFTSWSMDVKFEGENVVRHMDITTHNHNPPPGNSPPWMYLDTMAVDIAPSDHPCKNEIDDAQEKCKGSKKEKVGSQTKNKCEPGSGCEEAMGCILVPKSQDKKLCCDPKNTGHHLIPGHCCKGVLPGYNYQDAPCVCAGGWSNHRNDGSGISDDEKTHPMMHEAQDAIERKVFRVVGKLIDTGRIQGLSKDRPWKYKTVRNIGISAHKKVFKTSKCSIACMKSQLDDFHLSSDGVDENTLLKAKEQGRKIDPNDKSYQRWKNKFPDLPD
nr:PAAR-like domain-containing protein [uncultured Desulfobacter sp.]